MSHFEYEIKKLPAYRAMGLKCDVSFTEMEMIKDVIQHSISRANELKHAVNLDVRLGLSYHVRLDGFVYYSVYEVTEEQPLLDGLVEMKIPEMTYLITKHKGGSIEETYGKIMDWIKKSEYTPFKEKAIEYYDELPIKHERYPSHADPNDPHFEILIPVIRS